MDDQRDYEDQLSAPQSPMAHYPGSRNPLAQFLSDVPDWSVLDKAALDKALLGLPVPIVGPAPPGLSIQDAIKVKTPLPLLYIRRRMRCRIRHYIMYMAYDIIYDIVWDVLYDVLM